MHKAKHFSAIGLLSGIALTLAGCASVPNGKNIASGVPILAEKPAQSPVVQKLADRLSGMVADKEIPGAIVRILENGKVLANVDLGYRDVASQTPMAPDTIFRMYSMSKPITSVGIMMLAEEGKLSLDDPASKFLPEFHDMRVYAGGTLEDMKTVRVKRPITIRDLLTHTSGLTYHFTGNDPVHQYYRKYGVMRDTPVGRSPTDGEPAHSLDQLVERLGKAPMLYQPGEHFAYSYSTTVLGAIIERASGMRLDKFLKERIFDPLDMPDTGFFVQGKALDRFVVNYMASADGLNKIEDRTNTDYKDPSRLLDGGGAIASTTSDYLHFAEMLANRGIYKGHRLLSEKSVDAMFKPYVRIEGLGKENGEFGYGFAIGDKHTQSEGMQPADTYGWSGSGNTYFFVDPKHKAVTLLMTQVIVTPPYYDRALKLRKAVNEAAEALIH